MALNTVEGRASAIGINEIYNRIYPTPDGALDTAGDRVHVALSYRMEAEELSDVPTPDHDYQHQGLDLGMIGFTRSWSNA